MSTALTSVADVADIAAAVLGSPVHLTVLKHKPGRRCTWRAHGPQRSAIVKTYASERAATVAARLAGLAAGPPEPVVPELLHVDEHRRLVVLSELPGRTLRQAILSGDLDGCRAAGAAIAAWHTWWRDRPPKPLAAHTADAELAALDRWLGHLPAPQRRTVSAAARDLAQPWPCTTVVHRDLYEEQLILGERIGLIDLDDAASGPPELDIGNLAAHLELLALAAARRSSGTAPQRCSPATAPSPSSTGERSPAAGASHCYDSPASTATTG
jgi:Ser/Thr protein kinase RdoA (MazF antagonist)